MADLKVDAELDRLARELREAGHSLSDLEAANAEAGRVVLTASRPPRASGQLDASLTADASAQGVTWASTARYWTFVHWGAPRRNMAARPWFLQALQADQAAVVAVYSQHVTDSLKGITT